MSTADQTIVIKKRIENVKLEELTADPDIQQRSGWDDKNPLIAEYAQAILDGARFPPIVVFEDTDMTTRIADGFNRYEAHVVAKKGKIACDIRSGTKEDAIWFACGANASHGMRRSSKDKQRSVLTALKHPKSTGMSDRSIALHCGCSNTMVSQMRATLEGDGTIEVAETRVTSKGVVIPTAKADREKKSVAQKAGRPPKTVSKSDTEEEVDVEAAPTNDPAPAAVADKVVHKATAPIADGKMLDAKGTEVPEKLLPVFRQLDKFHLLTRVIRQTAASLRTLVASDAGLFLPEFDDAILESLADAIESATPSKVNAKYSCGWQPTNLSGCERNKDLAGS
jgi:hypothetical protein